MFRGVDQATHWKYSSYFCHMHNANVCPGCDTGVFASQYETYSHYITGCQKKVDKITYPSYGN